MGRSSKQMKMQAFALGGALAAAVLASAPAKAGFVQEIVNPL